MQKKLFVVIMIFSLILLFNPHVIFASSQTKMLPPSVSQSLHDVKVVEINSKDNLDQIWQLSKKPNMADIIKLNLKRKRFTSTHIKLLKSWVRKGNTIRITYKPNLIEEFGITASWEDIDDKEKTLGKILDKHEVCTDVEKVLLKTNYSSDDWPNIKSGYDVGLLERELEGTNRVLAVMKYLGNGTIYVVPQIIQNQYDGKRFYVNLLEFGAGYPVPPSVVSGTVFTEPSKKHDRVILKNGDVLSGKVLTTSFEVSANYGDFTFPKEKIINISQGENLYRLSLNTGDKLTGTLKNENLKVNLVTGGEKVIAFENIKKVVFSNN